MKKYLAIIPARAGSKRLPNKNILFLNGKPLIEWTIQAAKKSKYIDDIVVTSDSNKILEIANKYDIITLKRPKELATDSATTVDVIKHVLNEFNKYEYIVLLQPTSPLRNEKHIDEAIEMLETKKADAVISVCEMEHSPLWSNTLPDDLSMRNFLKEEIKNKRSQDLDKYYRVNGAIYICKTDKFLQENTLFLKDNIFAYIMDRKNSVDIDDEVDFKLAEVLISYEKNY
jgi:CMP-N-acetylneuraminic acid synthetase